MKNGVKIMRFFKPSFVSGSILNYIQCLTAFFYQPKVVLCLSLPFWHYVFNKKHTNRTIKNNETE